MLECKLLWLILMNTINITYVEMYIHNKCAVNIYDFQLYHINIILLCYYLSWFIIIIIAIIIIISTSIIITFCKLLTLLLCLIYVHTLNVYDDA